MPALCLGRDLTNTLIALCCEHSSTCLHYTVTSKQHPRSQPTTCAWFYLERVKSIHTSSAAFHQHWQLESLVCMGPRKEIFVLRGISFSPRLLKCHGKSTAVSWVCCLIYRDTQGARQQVSHFRTPPRSSQPGAGAQEMSSSRFC